MYSIGRYIYFLLLAGILAFASSPAIAQYEYITTLDYQNLSINRPGSSIPGVTRVVPNTAYDQNQRRFFFQGIDDKGGPWHLYTIDATNGSVIYDVVVGGGTQSDQISGLQYDNSTNILYAIYIDRTTGNYFSWIDPATGIAHPIKLLPNASDQSTFDTNDHLYIFRSGSTVYSIDPSTGNVVHSVTIAATNISYLKYDNTTGKLYGINNPASLPNPQFISISVITGAIDVIKDLPPLYTNSSGTYTIDEVNGKYIFLAQDAASTACVRNYLYVVDINTGNLDSKKLYPYAQNTGAITAENVIGYSFDNQRGVLYALNWHPPPAYPYINITASSNPICPGDPVTFTATPGATVVDPAYQWVFNGVQVGTNSTTYTNSNLRDKDTVYCIITNHELCVVNGTDTSNRIVIRYYTPPDPSVSIIASATQICSGQTVRFTATSINGGNSPVYQWQVNGTNTGTNSNTFTDPSLQDGDVVSCSITGLYNCSTTRQATSNSIAMQVTDPPNPYPSVTIAAASTTICSGTSTTFTATPASAGASPSYQWQLNGNNVGTNSNTFTGQALRSGDVIRCILTTSMTCASPLSSNAITMTANPSPDPLNPTVTISTSTTAICAGDLVTFTATPTNVTTTPTYQWQINGRNVGSNSISFTTTSLLNGAVINCIMNGNIVCVAPVSSNTLIMRVNPTPTVFAGNDTIIAPGGVVPLKPAVSGTIVYYKWTPATALSDPSIKNPVSMPDNTITYQLNVLSDEGCSASDKVVITVYRTLRMPNAFTPNGDGKNDIFRIPPSTPQQIKHFSVFDRWGTRVFITTDGSQGWNGTYNSMPQPAGTYVWQIEYKDLLTGKTVLAKGTVVLIR